MPVLLDPLPSHHLSLFTPSQATAWADEQRLRRGQLRVCACSPDESGFPELVGHLNEQGYAPSSRRFNTTYDFTYVNGPITWHEDQGNGLTALLLVNSTAPSTLAHDYPYVGELITSAGAFPLDPGDIVVFNSDSGHAWLSDFRCTFATVFVRRKRKSPHS